MRRFPPTWTIDEANDACFIVRDNTGQAVLEAEGASQLMLIYRRSARPCDVVLAVHLFIKVEFISPVQRGNVTAFDDRAIKRLF